LFDELVKKRSEREKKRSEREERRKKKAIGTNGNTNDELTMLTRCRCAALADLE